MNTRRRSAGRLAVLGALLLLCGAGPGRAQPLLVSVRASQPSPVSGAVVLTAEVPPDAGLLAVQFSLNGYVLDAPDTTPPYEVIWSAASASAGEHAITAEARYRSGTSLASAPLRLTVANPLSFNRTLYVDAAGGDDGRDGAGPATAWRTLEKANQAVAPGDTVRLRGVFRGQQIRPAVSGTAATPITFTSDPGQTAVLDGGRAGVAVRLVGRSYIVVDRLRIQNVAGTAVQLAAGAHHNVVRHAQVAGSGNAAVWGHAIRITESSDNHVERNELLDTGHEAANSGDSVWIANGSSRNRILDNTLRNAGHGLVAIGGDAPGDADVLDNVVAGNVLSNPFTTPLLIGWKARRTLVERNTIADGARNGVNYPRPGIQLNASDNVVRYNEIRNNAGAGLYLSAYTYRGAVAHDAVGNRIYHNVVHGNGTYGLWLSEKDSRSVRDNLIANNIFFRNGGFPLDGRRYTIGIEHYGNPTAWPPGSLNGNRLTNNILLRQPGTAGEPMALHIRTPGQGGNLTFTLAQLQASHREAAGNLELDPRFTDEAGRVFTLRPGSPAVDRGVPIPGVPHHGAAPDIGAFELDLRPRSAARPVIETLGGARARAASPGAAAHDGRAR